MQRSILPLFQKTDSPIDKEKKEDDHISATDETLQLLTRKLQDSDSTISNLKAEVNNLRVLVEHLSSENHDLKSRLSQSGGLLFVSTTSKPLLCDLSFVDLQNRNSGEDEPKVVNGQSSVKIKSQRPNSMYETREGLKVPNWQMLKNQVQI